MIVKNFHAQSFRNLIDTQIDPCENVNMIYGQNGQGKTNLIEGIWMFTGFKSFRTKRNSDLIAHDKDSFNIGLDFFSQNRDRYFQIKFSNQSQDFFTNNIKVKSNRSIIGEFLSVVFSPTHLNLIKGGPDEKRKFLDIAISQIKPSYARNISSYYKIIKQKNAFLRNFKEKGFGDELLDVFDEKLANYGALIIKERKNYIELLRECACEFYSGISDNREKISVNYSQFGVNEIKDENDEREIILNLLKNSRETDIKRMFTSKGPHRDDIDIKLNDMNIRNFASQGQQRSAALALKLAEAHIINKVKEEKAVILLDDVMSELDEKRQSYILNKLNDSQVFITCCEVNHILKMKSGTCFEINNGKVLSK